MAMTWDNRWAETRELLGQIVFRWGAAMGLVYAIPKSLEFENEAAIRLGLAALNGDGARIQHLMALISHPENLTPAESGRKEEAKKALKKLAGLTAERDGLIHGIPIISFKRDLPSSHVVRNGCYLVQERAVDDERRFIKVPDAATEHLAKLNDAYNDLQKVAHPILFEEWVAFLTAP